MAFIGRVLLKLVLKKIVSRLSYPEKSTFIGANNSMYKYVTVLVLGKVTLTKFLKSYI